MVTAVLLLRHAETALNRSGALRGQLEVPLSDRGVREAQQLAARIRAEYRLSAICSSLRLRARATADEIARATGLDVEMDDRFNDFDYGQWAGRTWNSFSPLEQGEFQRWQRNPETPLPGAEDPTAAQRRALAGLAAQANVHQGCIAIVTHDAILQVLLAHILSIDLHSYRGIVQHTAALNEIEPTAGGWRVRLLNSTWHLDDAG